MKTIAFEDAWNAVLWFKDEYGELSEKQLALGFQRLFGCKLVLIETDIYHGGDSGLIPSHLEFKDEDSYLMFTLKFGI